VQDWGKTRFVPQINGTRAGGQAFLPIIVKKVIHNLSDETSYYFYVRSWLLSLSGAAQGCFGVSGHALLLPFPGRRDCAGELRPMSAAALDAALFENEIAAIVVRHQCYGETLKEEEGFTAGRAARANGAVKSC
jgi:hypothetical protein